MIRDCPRCVKTRSGVCDLHRRQARANMRLLEGSLRNIGSDKCPHCKELTLKRDKRSSKRHKKWCPRRAK